MKYFFRLASLVFVILLLSIGCKKTDITIPPLQAHFIDTSGVYLVGDTTKPEFKIPVGFTQPVTSDTRINIKITSPTGATSGNQFTISDSVLTIPAGQALRSLTVTAANITYATGRIDTLILTISTPGLTGEFYQKFTLTIKSFFCPVELTSLQGGYGNTTEDGYGPYTTTVSNVTATGPTSATGEINNIFDFAASGFPNVTVDATFDWSDPYNYTVTIEEQSTGLALSGGRTLYLRTTPGGSSSFSACNNTISLKIDIYYYSPATGNIVYYQNTQNYGVEMAR
jgi:hypothetical protein